MGDFPSLNGLFLVAMFHDTGGSPFHGRVAPKDQLVHFAHGEIQAGRSLLRQIWRRNDGAMRMENDKHIIL